MTYNDLPCIDSHLFTFTITPTNGPGSQMLSATRAEMLAALDAGKTLLGYWTETRTILETTDTIKHEFRLESVSGTGADRGLAFVNYEQFYKSTLYVNGNDTVSFVDKEVLPAPMTKTEAMTQSVGMDNDGRLWTEPGASSGGGVQSIAKLVTLPASKWNADTKSQNVMVMGVLADERVQLVTSTPRTTSARAYTNAGIALTGREENIVTFTAETIPTEDIKLYVVRQEIKLSEYITFSSPESFSITVSSPKWDGTMEYSTDATTWTTWSGESVSAVADDTGLYSLYFRGTGNTIVTYDNDEDYYYPWEISGSNVYCDGNIETLLDYIEAGSGKHPTMANNCYNSMFRGCTSLVTTPDLPATTLANDCYSSMFRGCTSLVTAPDLPATTLANYCYIGMFQGCTSLKLSSTQTEEYTIAYRIPANGVGTTATNAMTNMFSYTGGTFTGTPVINTTYYLHKDNSIVQ